MKSCIDMELSVSESYVYPLYNHYLKLILDQGWYVTNFLDQVTIMCSYTCCNSKCGIDTAFRDSFNWTYIYSISPALG